MIKKKRKVSGNLGRTQHQNADEIYEKIRQRIGNTKSCPFYKGKKTIPGDKKTHNELNLGSDFKEVPIEDFDFQFDKRKGIWSLQSYCKTCYKVYRQARIKNSRDIFFNMTDDDIRGWYIKNVGTTMMCSKCKDEREPIYFRSSKSMEKGLHNICYDCEGGSGTSIREKEWLADGNWNSWYNEVLNLRTLKQVKCAGWNSSVNGGYCKGTLDGKQMHADHIIPLRAGGINDKNNFQPLCNVCNTKKSAQIDPNIDFKYLKSLVCDRYKNIILDTDSILTIERKLKKGVVDYIHSLYKKGSYKSELAKKKKEVNGQWLVERVYKKGVAWIKSQI